MLRGELKVVTVKAQLMYEMAYQIVFEDPTVDMPKIKELKMWTVGFGL
jgi:hypothetical protein